MGTILFLVAIVVVLVGVGFIVSKAVAGGAALIGVGVLLIILSTITIVGARNIGVVTTFGKVSEDTLPSGLHFKAPWSRVTDMDGTIQTLKYVGNSGNDLDCIGVRISDGQTACVSVVERHRTRLESADELYVDYRGVDDKTDGDINDAINDSLVRTQLTSALGAVFGDFDPLTDAGVGATATTATPQGIDYQALSEDLIDTLNERLADASSTGEPQVEMVQATITFVYFAESTQRRINQYQEEVAKTRIAEQREATATAEAAANEELSASISNDPNVLVSKCLDLVAEGHDVGFSCWPLAEGGPTLTAPVR